MAALDPMVEQLLEEGVQAVESLPSHATRISQLLSTHFPPQTLEAVHGAMRPSVAAGSVNTKVAELCSLAREEAAVAGAQFRAIEMWLRLKAPAVSDGNNFGVEIQNYVFEELSKMRTAMEAMSTVGKDYYWSRAEGLAKVTGEDKATTTITEDKELKEGKEETTKKNSSVTTKSTPKPLPDYQEYVVCVDVRQYHLVFNHLTDMRNNYIKAHVLFAKNMKKLNDPRGDGEGKTANVMSMF